MLLVPCPHCGPRNASDLAYKGESQARPDPNTASLEEWRSYLYIEDNPAGWLRETWYCRSGCRQHFVAGAQHDQQRVPNTADTGHEDRNEGVSVARLPAQSGEVIDRTAPIRFTWNGDALTAFGGDTIASALLASGTHIVSRSMKYHGPAAT